LDQVNQSSFSFMMVRGSVELSGPVALGLRVWSPCINKLCGQVSGLQSLVVAEADVFLLEVWPRPQENGQVQGKVGTTGTEGNYGSS
jgi:hypothetical protein